MESATHLRGVVSRIARRLNASATSEGLTPTQASVLGLIAARGPLGLAQLAELEGLNPTMLSRVVGALTSADLIVRTPDPADLRALQVAATAEGSRMHERIKSARARVVSDSAANLTDEQVQALMAALPALDALAEQLAQPAGRGQPARSAGRG
ncbi:MAG TPA: MarR family transcriptional regulator [Streptosporangiaceae bacterium]|nr:MarR family transcriptional regulator [Streptosporangiaceae bacterium]